jgi:hypothetical protein
MAKPGRNDLCTCGSGLKYKKCCESKDRAGSARNTMMLVVVGGAVLAALVVGVTSFTSERGGGATRVWSAEHGHYHDANGVQVP